MPVNPSFGVFIPVKWWIESAAQVIYNVVSLQHGSFIKDEAIGDKTMLHGQCHCGHIQYDMPAEVISHALCHCSDCRRHAGAPMVGWAMLAADLVKITGTPKVYKSSEHGRRMFCGDCGTGLFYKNDVNLPDLIDVQTGTLDEPDLLPAQKHIQTAERISWMETVHDLPKFARYGQ